MPLHYRIIRDRAHRDDDVMIVPYTVHEPWTCAVCGQENEDRVCCSMCSTERGDWLCDCGRKNRKGDRECSECGSPNQDAE